jgi:cytochrome c oxidase subunit 1
MLFALAFFFILVLGGLTGIMVASVPLDLQLHDTYFLVAHLHYVLIGGAVFPLFAAWYYWFPKITGRLMSERLGRWQFWLYFVGFNVAFYPMHHLGLRGMPRRVYTYPDEMGWGPLNLLSTAGAVLIALSVLLFIVNALRSTRSGMLAGENPWGAGTLEWATASPPPAYNFERPPVVRARDPLWERISEPPAEATEVSGLAERTREALVTTVVDALPSHRLAFPSPTVWPFVSAVTLSILFIGSIFTPWAVLWGAIPVAIAVTLWFWPKRRETLENLALEKRP